MHRTAAKQSFLSGCQERETFRSQCVNLILIVPTAMLHLDEAHVHLVSYAPTVQKSVAALTDCYSMLDHDDWDTSAA